MDEFLDLETFAKNFQQEVVSEATLGDQGLMLVDAFTQYVLEFLSECGEWTSGNACYFRQKGMQVNGWGWDPDTSTLDLCIAIYSQGEPHSITKREVDTAFNRLGSFFTSALNGLYSNLEEASIQYDLAQFIYASKSSIDRVRFYMISDGSTGDRLLARSPDEIDGFEVTFHIWDMPRIHRVAVSGAKLDDIEIDLVEEFGQALPCLRAPTTSDEFQSYLFVIPGPMLASLYDKYSSRLLELNVRSFLQARGKVNKGIKETILNEPDRFFAYNNGISATASEVELTHADDGSLFISHISDLQIVNGGQTTASLATTRRKEKADIDQVYVQAKLTVVPPERLQDIVPLISRNANSQNRVSDADLSSNHKLHVELEQLSRTIWAPSHEGGTRETRWYYERARGQYQNDVAQERTPARQRKFKEVHPPRQKITKTDLSKFEMTWWQKPHIVSRGAQKCFVEYMKLISENSSISPDESFFRKMCAKAILFKTCEQVVSKNKDLVGFRANVVTYTIALLAKSCEMRLDLENIWLKQSVGPKTLDALESLTPIIYERITNPVGGGNVSEWCKSEACWTSLQEAIALSSIDLESECIQTAGKLSIGDFDQRSKVVVSQDQGEDVEWALNIPSDEWFEIAKWAKLTSQLLPWQRGLAFSLGKLAGSQKSPSVKQAFQGRKLYDEAYRLGFKRTDAEV